jgi:hypothetical protein
MKYKANQRILLTQLLILLVFLGLTLCNEMLDIPHLLIGDETTSINQRSGEVMVEIFIFAIVVLIEILVMKKLLRRIKILEGFLPICANCKKIREEKDWKRVEAYISEHSLAKFTHSICPDCSKELYSDIDCVG